MSYYAHMISDHEPVLPSTHDSQEVDADDSSLNRAVASRIHIQRLTAKSIRTRNIVHVMDMLLGDIRDPMTGVADRSGAARAYCVCEERLAVLRGESKPPTISLSQSLDKPRGRERRARVVDVESVVKSLAMKTGE